MADAYPKCKNSKPCIWMYLIVTSVAFSGPPLVSALVATVPPTVQLARKLFGQQNFTIVYGWIFAAHQLGAAAIAFAAGAVRTFFGDYQLAFMSSGLLCLVAAGLVLRIARTRPAEGPRVPVPAYP